MLVLVAACRFTDLSSLLDVPYEAHMRSLFARAVRASSPDDVFVLDAGAEVALLLYNLEEFPPLGSRFHLWDGA